MGEESMTASGERAVAPEGIPSILSSSEKELSSLCGAATIEDAERFDTVRSIVVQTPRSGVCTRFALTNSTPFRLTANSPLG